MPIVKTPFSMHRPPSSHELTLEVDVLFTDFEKKEDLQCWIKAALFERDAGFDKVFFWTNGKMATVHSWTQIGSDAKDDYIGFFPGIAIKPSDPRVANGTFRFKTSIDLDSPSLRDRLRAANDRISGDPPHLGSENWEQLRAVVHAYNELAPTTASSKEELQTDVDPDN